MHRPVVITRPLAQATALAESIASIGRKAVIFPLLEIQPLLDTTALYAELQRIHIYALVAFVSPNAVDAVCKIMHSWPKEVAIAVMGEGSRTALSRHGITSANATIVSPRNPQRTDSQTLLEALDIENLRGKQVLIIRGETGREFLADALRGAGVQITQVAAYRRRAPALDQIRREQLLLLAEDSAEWIITSSEALRVLVQMAQQINMNNIVAKLQRKTILVPHMRIAETAQSLGFVNIVQTGSGDEQLLAALQFET